MDLFLFVEAIRRVMFGFVDVKNWPFFFTHNHSFLTRLVGSVNDTLVCVFINLV